MKPLSDSVDIPFDMAPVAQSSFKLAPTLEQAIFESEVIAVDVDGCLGNTEFLQMLAFTILLNEKTGIEHDMHDIAKIMLGKAERVILTEFKRDYGVQGDLEKLLLEREKLYLREINASGLKANPGIVSALQFAKELGKDIVILSNGRIKIIPQLLKKWNVTDLFNNIFAIDTREIADKTEFLIQYADGRKAMMFEDSKSTLTKMDDRTEAWLKASAEAAKRQPKVRLVEKTDPLINEAAAKPVDITGVYVVHQFNDQAWRPKSGFAMNIETGALIAA